MCHVSTALNEDIQNELIKNLQMMILENIRAQEEQDQLNSSEASDDESPTYDRPLRDPGNFRRETDSRDNEGTVDDRVDLTGDHPVSSQLVERGPQNGRLHDVPREQGGFHVDEKGRHLSNNGYENPEDESGLGMSEMRDLQYPKRMNELDESDLDQTPDAVQNFTSVPMAMKLQASPVTFQNSSGRKRGSPKNAQKLGFPMFDLGPSKLYNEAGYQDHMIRSERVVNRKERNTGKSHTQRHSERHLMKRWGSQQETHDVHTFRNCNNPNFKISNEEKDPDELREHIKFQNHFEESEDFESDDGYKRPDPSEVQEHENCFKNEVDDIEAVANHQLELDLADISSIDKEKDENGEQKMFNYTPMQSKANARESNLTRGRISSEFEMRKSGVLKNRGIFKIENEENMDYSEFEEEKETRKRRHKNRSKESNSKEIHRVRSSKRSKDQRSEENQIQNESSLASEMRSSKNDIYNQSRHWISMKKQHLRHDNPGSPHTISEKGEDLENSFDSRSVSKTSNEIIKIMNPPKAGSNAEPEPVMCKKHKKRESIYWHVEKQKLLCADCLIEETGTPSERKQNVKELRTHLPVLQQKVRDLSKEVGLQVRRLEVKRNELGIRLDTLRTRKSSSVNRFSLEFKEFVRKIGDLKGDHLDRLTGEVWDIYFSV